MTQVKMKKTVLITGGNRGIGKACAERLLREGETELILTARDITAFRIQDWPNVLIRQLDLSSEESIAEMIKSLRREKKSVDILINNAGMSPGPSASPMDVKAGDLKNAILTNAVGPFLLTQALFGEMMHKGFGRIVNVSSQMGSFESLDGFSSPYRISKTCLNAVTKVFASAAEESGEDILVNSVCPGWVRSDMGGASAPRSIEQGASGIVWAASLPAGGPNGKFFLDQKPVPW